MSEEAHRKQSDKSHAGVATADTLAASDGSEANDTEALPSVDASHYALGEEIARGGLGRIRRAEDKRLHRTVAIKELLGDDPALSGRFAREALLTARLQHPSVVPVYEAGRWADGNPFYAMKLVSGGSLETAFREAVTLDERLALLPHIIDVVQALAYAHGQGIIHRDLKPANVLVGAFGETVVIDWGLAKDLRQTHPDAAAPATAPARVGGTVTGAVMGTPAYMSPEQALADPADERSDVYALGAILYHLLAGEPPFTGKTTEQILLKVVHETPEAIAVRAPGAPTELIAIAKKAMARRPQDRYPTAAELADDLNRFRHGQLVRAHRYSTASLIWRSVKRHRAAVTVAAVMLTLLIAGGIWSFGRIVRERDTARLERAEAQRLRLEADRRGDELSLREFDDRVGSDPGRALRWLGRLSPTFSRWGAARVRAADALSRGVPFRVDNDEATALALAPDGALLAEARDDGLLLNDVRSSQSQTLPGSNAVVRFSADGQELVWGSDDGVVRYWDRRLRAVREVGRHAGQIRDLALGDGVVVAAAADGFATVWSLAGTASPVALPVPEVQRVFWIDKAGPTVLAADGTLHYGKRGMTAFGARSTAAETDGRRIAAVGNDRVLRVWENGATQAWGRLAARATVVAAAPGLIATGDEAGEVKLWRDARPELLGRLGTEIVALGFAADGTLVAAAHDRTVVVWDAARRHGRWILGHEGAMVSAVLSANAKLLITAARDEKVRYWDLDAGQPRTIPAAQSLWGAGPGAIATVDGDGDVRLVGAGGPLRDLGRVDAGASALAVAPSGRVVVAGPKRNVLFPEKRDLGEVAAPARAAALSQDGRRLAIAEGAEILVHDLQRGGAARRVPAAEVRSLAFSPGGVMLAATAGEHVLLFTFDGLSVRDLGAQPGADVVAFSPDSRWVAAAGSDGEVRLASIRGDETHKLRGSGGRVRQLTFTSDARWLVGGGDDGSVRVWEVSSGKRRILPGHGGPITALSLSADGHSLVTGSVDKTVRVWDLESGATRVLSGHTAPVRAVAFLPGAVVSAGEDQTFRIWPDDLPVEPELLYARIIEMLR